VGAYDVMIDDIHQWSQLQWVLDIRQWTLC